MNAKSILKRLTAETYWKERTLTLFLVTFLLIGNGVEMVSGKVTNDSPVVWIAGGIVGIATVVVSLIGRYKKYTPLLFKIFLFYLNLNLVYAYSVGARYCRQLSDVPAVEQKALPATAAAGTAVLTGCDDSLALPVVVPEDSYECCSGITRQKSAEAQSFYILFTYILFVVTCFALDSRRELLLFTLGEVALFVIAILMCYQYQPLIMHSMQIFTMAVVLIGNYLVQNQRLRLTQASVGASVAIQFKSISENSRDTQVILDKDYRFVYLNPSVKSLTGYDVNALVKKEIFELVMPEDIDKIREALHTVSTHNNERVSVEYRIRKENGEPVWVESIFSPFDSRPEEKGGLVFAETRNVELRKKLEEELQHQLHVEEMLIKHSTQFINVDRTEIQMGIDQALGEFGTMLGADAALVYRMSGKLHDEFQSTNQWFAGKQLIYIQNFNLIVKINQKLVFFLRTLKGEKASWGNYITASHLKEIQVLAADDFPGKKFYLIPMQSGNIVNGFIIFVFNDGANYQQSSFFGLIGSMIANAFTRLRTETRLHEAQLTNEYILRALPDWLYIVDSSGEFTGTNEYSTLEAYLPDFDLVGREFADVMPEEMAVHFKQALVEVADTEKSISFEYHDSAIYQGRYFKVIIAPFKADEYLLIIRDVTDLKEAQKELESKALKLEQSNKDLEDFAYVVSHDMKQPIRTIISYLALLQKKYNDKLDEQGRDFINFSIEGANKMSDLIRDILQYSRVDQQIDLVSEVSLQNLMQKVLGNLQGAIMANNATVECDVLPTIKGNETMLGELFQNLVENGMKYNLSPAKKVKVTVKDEGEAWLFEVADNGIGFDEQYAQQIFKMFKRLHTDEEFPGTGIGLSICHKVVTKHGGKIWAHSVKGQGSHFYFTLPKA